MRYFCVVVLLAWTVGPAEVFVADQQPAGGVKGTKPREQPRADIPEAFGFLFHSPEQRTREIAQRGVMTYLEDLWKGLPYDSISLERGRAGGCLIVCPSSTVTLHRATLSGIVMPGPCRTAPCPPGDLRGRAELRTVPPVDAAVAGLQASAPRISEGSVRLYEFAMLSYLLHKTGFLELPNEYEQDGFDRPFVTVTVVAGGKAKAVTDYGEGIPVELWAIHQALDSVSKSIQWTQK